MAWSDLEVVLAICRAGSLCGAARDLGCTHSTVFRRINAIEKSVGVRFFERLPRGYVMTEAGQVALTYAERVESEFHALHREVLGRDAELRGDVGITAPQGLVDGLLPALMAEFRRRHPRVTIELTGGSPALHLRRREADIAIRDTRQPPDDALGRRICAFRFGYYASPDYLAAHGDRALADHDFIAMTGSVGWLVPHVWKTQELA